MRSQMEEAMTAKTVALGARNVFGGFAELFQHLVLVFGPELVGLGSLLRRRRR